jgi:hypothetical protein
MLLRESVINDELLQVSSLPLTRTEAINDPSALIGSIVIEWEI